MSPPAPFWPPPVPFWPQKNPVSGGFPGPEPRASDQRGSVLPLVALVILALGGLCVALAGLGRDAVTSAQARIAADAAALAGAAEGEAVARQVAEDNGAEVVAYIQEGVEVEVRARVERTEAVARATREDAAATIGFEPGG